MLLSLLKRTLLQSVQTLRARNRLLSFVGIPHTGIVQLWMRAQLSRSLRSNSMKGFRAYNPLAALVRPTQALVRLVKAALLLLLPVRLLEAVYVVALHALSR